MVIRILFFLLGRFIFRNKRLNTSFTKNYTAMQKMMMLIMVMVSRNKPVSTQNL